MSYLEMARSHVKELAREAFDLTEVVVDRDGDLPFPYGTAVLHISVVADGRLVRAWSRAVEGVAVTKPVLREVNDVNASLVLARTWVDGHAVMVEGCLPVEPLRARDLKALVHEVGRTADRLGTMLATVHGGQVVLPAVTAVEGGE